MPFNAGDILYASDLNGLIPQQFEAPCTVAKVVATTLDDITGCSVTFNTINDNALVLVVWTMDCDITVASAGTVALTQMTYDGVTHNTRQALKDLRTLDRITVTQRDQVVLATAGSHTIKMQTQKTAAGGTCTLQTNHTGFTLVLYDAP